MHVNNQIEDPRKHFEETTAEERKCNFEAAKEGHGLPIKESLLKPHSGALKCEGTTIAKVPQETASEVLVSCSIDNGYARNEHEGLTLPPVMIEVDTPKPKKTRALVFQLCETIFQV